MNNIVSILHISDLHKNANDNYNNLMESLKNDCEGYTRKESITKPNIVVVSGDIIKGGSNEEIKQQYLESTEFLNHIVDYFLDGNKEKMIIIPGNHDIDWNASKSSMIKIEIENNSNLESILYDYHSGSTEIRWSWKDLCFYSISEKSIYNKRLDPFIDFYNAFFDGIKSYSDNPDGQYQIYDYSDFNIAFIGFNSCYRNDHLNNAGNINPTCITNATVELKKLHDKGRLLIGVWHHNTSGQPNENNYLDSRILRAMIDRNIKIGLHGHQHVCSAVNEYKNVFDKSKIMIFSAGTLYGHRQTLPHGTSRQYNIIEIKTDNKVHEITIHSREDVDNDLFEIPCWNKGRIDRTYNSSWSTSIIQSDQPNINEILDKLMQETEKTGDLRTAIDQLRKLDTAHLLVRKVLVDYLKRLHDDQLICELLIEPLNNEESILLMNSALQIYDKIIIKNVLDIPTIKESKDAAVRKLYQSLKNLI